MFDMNEKSTFKKISLKSTIGKKSCVPYINGKTRNL